MHTTRLYGIRGAVCTENNSQDLQNAVCTLISALFEKNGITEADIVSIQFTVTNDLTCLNPAAALRRSGLCTAAPLFCAAEPKITGSLPKTIRVLITAYSDRKPVHLYMGEAQKLRPDLCAASGIVQGAES